MQCHFPVPDILLIWAVKMVLQPLLGGCFDGRQRSQKNVPNCTVYQWASYVLYVDVSLYNFFYPDANIATETFNMI